MTHFIQRSLLPLKGSDVESFAEDIELDPSIISSISEKVLKHEMTFEATLDVTYWHPDNPGNPIKRVMGGSYYYDENKERFYLKFEPTDQTPLLFSYGIKGHFSYMTFSVSVVEDYSVRTIYQHTEAQFFKSDVDGTEVVFNSLNGRAKVIGTPYFDNCDLDYYNTFKIREIVYK